MGERQGSLDMAVLWSPGRERVLMLLLNRDQAVAAGQNQLGSSRKICRQWQQGILCDLKLTTQLRWSPEEQGYV